MRGPAVLLLHSSLSTGRQWRGLATALEHSYDVLAADLLGYGEAPPVADPEGYSLGDETAHLLALADARFGRGAKFHVVGHSYGGLAALALAREQPARVSGLAVYEPVCFNLASDGDPDLGLLRRVAANVAMLVRSGRLAEATGLFFDYWNGPGEFKQLPVAAKARFIAGIAKVPLDFQAAFLEPRVARAYAAITAPTLLMGGTQSPRLTRNLLKRLSNAMPNAALAWVEGGHMAPVAAPGQFNLMLGSFLDWTAPTARAA
jgi:pimeloyl-ACP methyl ester carboxylesterase